jgi:NAD(P)-dependent dehydrogenase (short-subunit alcohol dehydrogenase family)
MGVTIKTIVITGASSGIGRATALRPARNGWRVIAAVRKDEDARSIEADAQGALERPRDKCQSALLRERRSITSFFFFFPANGYSRTPTPCLIVRATRFFQRSSP